MKASIFLDSTQQFALRTLVTTLRDAYEFVRKDPGLYHLPQDRGMAIQNQLKLRMVQWAKNGPHGRPRVGMRVVDKPVPTLLICVNGIAFVPRKFRGEPLASLDEARLVFNRVERRRVDHTCTVKELNLFPNSEATEEAAALGIKRYVYVVHIGEEELLQVWVGERIDKTLWDGDKAVLNGPIQVPVSSGRTLLAFDQGEVPPPPAVHPVAQGSTAETATSRFQDVKEDLDLSVTGRRDIDSDQEETNKDA